MTFVAVLPVASWGLVERLEGKQDWCEQIYFRKVDKNSSLDERERRTGRYRKVDVAKNI